MEHNFIVPISDFSSFIELYAGLLLALTGISSLNELVKSQLVEQINTWATAKGRDIIAQGFLMSPYLSPSMVPSGKRGKSKFFKLHNWCLELYEDSMSKLYNSIHHPHTWSSLSDQNKARFISQNHSQVSHIYPGLDKSFTRIIISASHTSIFSVIILLFIAFVAQDKQIELIGITITPKNILNKTIALYSVLTMLYVVASCFGLTEKLYSQSKAKILVINVAIALSILLFSAAAIVYLSFEGSLTKMQNFHFENWASALAIGLLLIIYPLTVLFTLSYHSLIIAHNLRRVEYFVDQFSTNIPSAPNPGNLFYWSEIKELVKKITFYFNRWTNNFFVKPKFIVSSVTSFPYFSISFFVILLIPFAGKSLISHKVDKNNKSALKKIESYHERIRLQFKKGNALEQVDFRGSNFEDLLACNSFKGFDAIICNLAKNKDLIISNCQFTFQESQSFKNDLDSNRLEVCLIEDWSILLESEHYDFKVHTVTDSTSNYVFRIISPDSLILEKANWTFTIDTLTKK